MGPWQCLVAVWVVWVAWIIKPDLLIEMDEGPEFLPGLFLVRGANYRFVFFAFFFAKIAFPLFYTAVTDFRGTSADEVIE